MLTLQEIKAAAATAGFDLCGVTRCRPLTEASERFRQWLEQGCQSSLSYLERNVGKRFDPQQLVEGARTAVVCAVNYKNRFSGGYPEGWPTKIASYACNRDYHDTIRTMLRQLFDTLRQRHPELRGRAFVDTAPLAEKAMAVEAGLGWIGRQSLLVTPQFGTFVLLGELLLCDEAEEYDTPLPGAGCGSCRACVEHCPAGAIAGTRMIDTNRCIACHTIERPPAQAIDLDGWIFGCDACQTCCPYNRRTPLHRHPAFDPLIDPLTLPPAAWRAMSEAEFAERMGVTPLTRSGLVRIRQNIGTPEAPDEHLDENLNKPE